MYIHLRNLFRYLKYKIINTELRWGSITERKMGEEEAQVNANTC